MTILHTKPQCAARRAGDTAERFWRKADKSAGVDGCWIWTGSIKPNGYGNFQFHGRMSNAHRVAYQLHCGPIPKGLCVLHKCDNRACVNPAHLWLGTRKDNYLDCVQKGRAGFQIDPEKALRGLRQNNPEHRSRGEDHYKAKLTGTQVQSIRHRYHSGSDSMRSLARHFGLTRQSVSAIIYRKSWKHID